MITMWTPEISTPRHLLSLVTDMFALFPLSPGFLTFYGFFMFLNIPRAIEHNPSSLRSGVLMCSMQAFFPSPLGLACNPFVADSLYHPPSICTLVNNLPFCGHLNSMLISSPPLVFHQPVLLFLIHVFSKWHLQDLGFFM